MRSFCQIRKNLSSQNIYFFVIKNESIQSFCWKSHFSTMIMKMDELFLWFGDRRKAFSLISNWDHCQRSSPLSISDTPRAGFDPAQNLSSGLLDWSCAVVILLLLLAILFVTKVMGCWCYWFYVIVLRIISQLTFTCSKY